MLSETFGSKTNWREQMFFGIATSDCTFIERPFGVSRDTVFNISLLRA